MKFKWLPGVSILVAISLISGCRAGQGSYDDVFASCSAGTAEACREAAYVMEVGLDGRVDADAAEKLYSNACEMGDDFSCFWCKSCAGRKPIDAGVMESDREFLSDMHSAEHMACCSCINWPYLLMNIPAWPEEFESSLGRYIDACSRGDEFLCTTAGLVLATGKGPFKTWESAAYFDRGCASGLDVSCRLRDAANDGNGNGWLGFERASGILNTICDVVSRPSTGKGIEPDSGEERNRTAACLGAALLSLHLDESDGALKNARRQSAVACEGNSAEGCDILGLMVLNDPPPFRCTPPEASDATLKLFRRSCDAGYTPGCLHLGLALFYNALNQGGWELSEARKYFQEACDGGDAEGCMAAAHTVKAPTTTPDFEEGDWVLDKVELRKFYKAACDLGHPKGCQEYGVMLISGDGGASDKVLARKKILQACDSGLAEACEFLASWLDDNDSDVDRALTASLYARTVDMTATEQCFEQASRGNVYAYEFTHEAAQTACWRSCFAGHGDDCASLADLWHEDLTGLKAAAAVADLCNRARSLGYEEECPLPSHEEDAELSNSPET